MKFLYKFFRLITALKITNQGFLAIFHNGFSVASSILANNIQSYCGGNIRTVFDVGANKGQFAIAIAKLFPQSSIYSFEPTQKTFNNLVNNSSSYKNINCYNLALGEEVKEVDFYETDYSHANSVLPISEFQKKEFLNNSSARISKVKMSTFDNIFDELNIQSPVLLKLDVQGYEKIVLEGAKKSLEKIDFILIETSFIPFYDGEPLFGEMNSYLNEKGFEVVAPLDIFQTDSMQIVQMDMLYKKRR